MADNLVSDGYICNKYFTRIYPFTTENISGYLPLFDLENKTLLTVGSSGDQILNAILYGCTNIDMYDLCPFSKEYYNMKKAAVQVLSREEFINFFCNRGYHGKFDYNNNAFNISSYFKMREVLKNIDYDSFYFWDYLFSSYGGLQVRERLFSDDEDFCGVITKINDYLINDEMFLKLRNKINDVEVKFKNGDIFDFELDKSYDNIFLSNIACYNDVLKMRELFDKLLSYLNDYGRILITYLYQTVIDSKYNKEWAPIYDIENTLSLFPDDIDFSSFIGIKGIRHNTEKIKDSVITYKKVKKM